MEDGPQSDTPKQFVIRSGVRSGHKRELAFALKSQANISSSLSRTRSGRLPSPSSPPPSKKSKKKLQDSVKKYDICDGIIEEKEEEKAVADDSVIVVHSNNTVASSNVVLEENGSLDKQQLMKTDNQSSLSGLNASDGKLDLDAKSGEIVQNKESSPSERFARSFLKAEDTATTAIIEPPLEHSDLVDVTVELKKEEKAVPENSIILVEQVEIVDRYIELHEENGVSEKLLPLIKDKPSLLEQQNLDAKTSEVIKNKVSLPSRRFTRSLLKAEDASVVSASSSDESVELDDPSSKKMELKMSKKIGLNKLPSNVRDLLGTGLLEGLPVKYDTLVGKRCQLDGVIKGNGILCFCSSCKGSKAISAFLFELHAGSTKNCPVEYIFLNNGKSIGDVLRACTSAPLDLLASVIQNAIAEVPSTNQYTCQNCKDAGKFALLCEPCLEQGNKQVSLVTPPLVTPTTKPPKKSFGNSFKKTPSSRKKTLQTRVAEEGGPDSSSEKVSFLKTGKITKKDVSLHKLVFMDDILPEGTEVGYFVRGRKLLEGYIKDQGIYCHHCNCVVAPSGFEAHAGNASRRKPYHNIYTSNGVSLHELSVSLSKGRKKASKENDDLCCICGDGGDLLLCDLCPRAFHIECVGMSNIPEGDYECRYCQLMHEREKNVAYNANAIAAGRVAGVDPIEQIIQRCIRIVKTSNDISSCVLCKCHDFSRSSFDDRTVIICDQCEKEYHVGCLRLNNMCDLKELPKGKWFCCDPCSTIHATLQDLLFKPFPIQSAHVDIIKKRHEKNGSDYDGGNDVRWRLVSGKLSHADTKLLLSEAITIFHGSFSPIVDAAGRDLIPSMVYGREVGDQDYGGMYCAILTVNSSVVSAGILRILGSVAELPLVATSKDRQGLGYFQSLFSCIEELLVSLKVKHFVLPSADESEAIWVKKFGFVKITPEQLNDYAQGAHLMFFQGTSWLYKPVPDPVG